MVFVINGNSLNSKLENSQSGPVKNEILKSREEENNLFCEINQCCGKPDLSSNQTV